MPGLDELSRLRQAIEDLPGHIAGQRRDQDAAFVGELYRGVKRMRFAVQPTTPATSLTLPGSDSGFIWDVRLIAGTLSAADSVAAYAGEQANNRLFGYAAPPGAAPAQNLFVINPSSRSAVLDPGESIFLATSGTGNITKVSLWVIQVPAEMVGKLLI